MVSVIFNQYYYGKSIRHSDIRSSEHIGVSPLAGKKVKPSNDSVVYDHLLHCNILPSFDNSSIVACENNLLEIKGALSDLRQFLATESPLKMRKNAFYLP